MLQHSHRVYSLRFLPKIEVESRPIGSITPRWGRIDNIVVVVHVLNAGCYSPGSVSHSLVAINVDLQDNQVFCDVADIIFLAIVNTSVLVVQRKCLEAKQYKTQEFHAHFIINYMLRTVLVLIFLTIKIVKA